MPVGAVDDGVYGLTNGSYKNQPVIVSLSGVTAEVAAVLPPGAYRVVSTVACMLRQSGATGNTATTSWNYLPADTIDFIHVVVDSTDWLTGITEGGTGNLYLTLL